MIKLIRELRQRRVFRGAGYYLLIAWGVLQVGDVIVEPAGLPAWSMTALLYLLMLGFPIAMVLSWRYDIGEHGIVRTQSGDLEDAPPESLRAVDYLVILGLVGISGAALWGLLPIAQQAEQAQETRASLPDLAPNSIAVLPFADISQTQDQGFLGDGISDTVMHVLSQIADLTVTARTSSFAFKGKNLSIPEIAAALSVAHVLEGSVQKAGEQVRIIARLIDARSGTEVWSGYYDRAIDSVFAIQDEIAREVATALTTEVLKSGDVDMIEQGYRPNLDAYEKFILGKQEFSLRTTPAFERAKSLFLEATELDPNYALAYAFLAEATLVAAARDKRAEGLAQASVYAAKALDLDPLLPEAHGVSANLLVAEKRFPEAEAAIQRALELRPSYADAYATYSFYYRLQGQVDEALAQLRKAIELDPQENRYMTSLAGALWSVSRAEEAMATIKEAIKRNPDVPSNYGLLGRWYMQLGDIGRGAYWQERSVIVDGGEAASGWPRCLNLVQMWAHERAIDCAQDYLRRYPGDVEATQYVAVLTGDVELGLKTLGEAVASNPNFWYRRYQLADWQVKAKQWQGVLDTLKPSAKGLFASEPEITDQTIWAAINVAQAYFGLGDEENAIKLSELGLRYINQRRKLQGAGYVAGVEDVQFLTLLGREEEALSRLERTVASGWRFYSFGLQFGSVFDPLRDSPRFESVLDTIRDDLAEQLAWYDANRDMPPETIGL
ncbi:MAG: hypothetical protein Cons2KO_12750 [Congregibacter sp.]